MTTPALRVVPLIVDPDYNCRSMAAHFLRRLAQGVEQGWTLDPLDVQLALNFLLECEPTLFVHEESISEG
jgi:hypothetical protein